MVKLAQHPGVVELVGFGDLGEHDGEPCAEMQLVHVGSHSLATLPLRSVSHASALVAAAAETVADLHSMGIVHGGLEPRAVLIDGEGRPVLAGFTDAALVGEPHGPEGVPARPAEDLPALANLLQSAIGTGTEPDPIPDRRGARRSRSRAYVRRALLNLADQATADDASLRPSARSFAAAVRAVEPDAHFIPPACLREGTSRIDAPMVSPDTDHDQRPGHGREAAGVLCDPTGHDSADSQVVDLPSVSALLEDAARHRVDATDPDPVEAPGAPDSHNRDRTDDEDRPSLPRRPISPRPGRSASPAQSASPRSVLEPSLPGHDRSVPGDKSASLRRPDPVSPPRQARRLRPRRGAPVAAALVGMASLTFGLLSTLHGERPNLAEASAPVPAPADATAAAPSGAVPSHITTGEATTAATAVATTAEPTAEPREEPETGTTVSSGDPPAPDPMSPTGATGSHPGAETDVTGCPSPSVPSDPAVAAGPCSRSYRLTDGVLVAGQRRYAIGQAGDEILVGDWHCTGQPVPALVRPSTGDMYVFTGWASPGTETIAKPLGNRGAGSHLETGPALSRAGCPSLLSRAADGTTQPVDVSTARSRP